MGKLVVRDLSLCLKDCLCIYTPSHCKPRGSQFDRRFPHLRANRERGQYNDLDFNYFMLNCLSIAFWQWKCPRGTGGVCNKRVSWKNGLFLLGIPTCVAPFIQSMVGPFIQSIHMKGFKPNGGKTWPQLMNGVSKDYSVWRDSKPLWLCTSSR